MAMIKLFGTPLALKGKFYLKCALCCLTLSALSLPLNAQAQNNNPIKVCAVPQLYQALNFLQDHSKVKFEPHFATANELYAQISNAPNNDTTLLCDVVLSSDERLPISLIRSQKAVGSSMYPFARSPLVLWSADPKLLNGHDPRLLIERKKITSFAIASANLTPVGFASNQVVKRNDFKISLIKDRVYKSDHEYQVYSMVANGNVQCGLISKPLIASINNKTPGSYYQVPRSWHSDIQYYVVLLEQSKNNALAQQFIRYLISNQQAHEYLKGFGFENITPE